jgi:hypothetical protein
MQALKAAAQGIRTAVTKAKKAITPGLKYNFGEEAVSNFKRYGLF